LKKIKSGSDFYSCPNSKVLLVVNVMNILFVVVLYTINKYILKIAFIEEMNIFFNHYFNDLLAPIVLLSFIDFLLFNKTSKKRLIYIKISIMFFAAIFWEFITPIYLYRSVTDIYDLLMYFLGTIIYFGINQVRSI